MRFLLLLSSCFLLFTGCTTMYKQLAITTGKVADVEKYKPAISVALYAAQVDVAGNHLSGLLMIKKMPDSSTRLVFSNEMGFTFFDFEFTSEGLFKVHSVIKKMNKKSVLTTLKKDFELVLMQKLTEENLVVRKSGSFLYYIFPQKKGYYCYIIDSISNKMDHMERSSKRKSVVSAIMNDYKNGMPDTIGITHHNFNFTIGLKKLEK